MWVGFEWSGVERHKPIHLSAAKGTGSSRGGKFEMEDEIHVHREEDTSGVRGGAAAAYAQGGAYAQPVERGLLLKDRVRWASVWGGYVVAFALQLWLTAIGFAIFAPRAGVAVATGTAPIGASTGLAIWAGVAALIALFVGGLLASKLAGIAGTYNGVYNGVVLWGLSFVILLVLTSLGGTGILGAMTGNLGATTPTTGTAGNVGSALINAGRGTWWFVVFQFLGLLAAALGGAAGARAEEEEVVRT